MKNNCIAIIPARSGSKGIAKKNLARIDGKSLIEYSIEAALNSKELSEIMVSSDSREILDIAGTYPGLIIHKRPATLASDDSPITATIKQILSVINKEVDNILLLQPTSPIKTGEDIDNAIQLLIRDTQANSVISVCEMQDVHPGRMYWKEDSYLSPVMVENEQVRRQDMSPVYFRNGAIYLVRSKAFKENNSMMVKPTIPYIMPGSKLLNIDEPRDLIIAEALIPAWKKGLLE